MSSASRMKTGLAGVCAGESPAHALHPIVVDVLTAALADTPNLRQQIMEFIEKQSQAAVDGAALEDLRKRREELRRKTELIVSMLDAATLADAKAELGRLSAQRRELDEQINAAQTAAQAVRIDPEQIADRVVANATALSANLKTLPTFTLREVLAAVVEKVVVDMETKHADVFMSLPVGITDRAMGEELMRPVGTSPSPTYYETHQRMTVVLAAADCRYVKGSHSV